MSRTRLIAMVLIGGYVLLDVAASYARSEKGVALLAIVGGCAVIAFRRWFAHEVTKGRGRSFRRGFGERDEGIARWMAVLVGIGWVAWGVTLLMGMGHIRGWD